MHSKKAVYCSADFLNKKLSALIISYESPQLPIITNSIGSQLDIRHARDIQSRTPNLMSGEK